jgi:S1-C subfamily serine protease
MKSLSQKVSRITLLFGLISLTYGTSLFAEYHYINAKERTLRYKGSHEKSILSTNVSLYRNQKKIALGTIVDSRGLLLTKASASVGAKYGINASGEKFSVRIRKRDENTDLALLQIIDSNRLWPAIQWDLENNRTAEGCWIISPHENLQYLHLSMLSGKVRKVPREGGVMGIIFADNDNPNVSIIDVLPQSAGDRGGLQVGDTIISVDGRQISGGQMVHNLLRNKDPGDLMILKIKRRGVQLEKRITLGHRSVTFDLFNRNLLMSGSVSKRKDNFPKIIQHDAPLPYFAMGGGMFSPMGQCLGINIARVDRVTTYAIPFSEINPLLEKWLIDIP